MDINYINSLLEEGKSVKDVRGLLGISEKKFLKEIKLLGYKFDQKKRQYIKDNKPVTDNLTVTRTKGSLSTTNSTTNTPTVSTTNQTTETTTTTLTATQTTTIDYLSENIGLIKQLLENYKRNTEANNNTDIVINLVSDKHLDPKPKSIRINEFVWRDWQEFTKELTYSKSDLISQALKEFMENHQ